MISLFFNRENSEFGIEKFVSYMWWPAHDILIKFIYFEKATKFCEISTVDLTITTQDKSKLEISQNFVAFSKYMNFNTTAEISKSFLKITRPILILHKLNTIQCDDKSIFGESVLLKNSILVNFLFRYLNRVSKCLKFFG